MHNARLKYFLLLLSLSILGVLGNYLNLPLFFGVSFIFGSIAVLVAIRLLGTVGAIIVALIAGSYTFFIWGHPYAMVIFTVEALVVGILWQHKISSLALADIIFWLAAGIPLVWFFYSGVMNMESTPTSMIGLKQAVNGVANAIIATYLMLLIPPKYILAKDESSIGKMRLNELFFTTLLGIPLVFSFVMMSIENKMTKENLENGLTEQLDIYLEHIRHEIQENNMQLGNDKFEVMVFTDKTSFINNRLPFKSEQEFFREGSIKKINDKLWLWMPERKNLPLMIWWKKAYYFIKNDISESENNRVYVLQNTHFVINKIQNNILVTFKLLFALIIIGGIIAYLISQSLTGTIVKLTEATKNLPEKLKKHSKIEWPESNISEFLQLSRQAKIMSDNIGSRLDEVNMQAKTILESSIDSIVTIDEKGVALSFNNAAESLFGYSRDEVVGKYFRLLAFRKDEKLQDESHAVFRLEKNSPAAGKRMEVVGHHKDGHLLPIELSVTKTEVNNNIRYTGIITDISERKINEQLKSDFISTVSHELRTPLTSINGSIKLVYAQQNVLSQENIDELLGTAARNIDRLTVLIDDLLDFEKLDSSGVEYEKENIKSSALIESVLEQTTNLSEQAGVSLKQTYGRECEFIADPQRVSQVLVNLISNAIKFSPEYGEVEISCICDDKRVKLFVKDNGVGIPDKFKAQIFERFTQADSADNRKIQRGTGLGLAISKRMTEGMGGTIGFDSIEGQGSIFYISFPK